MIRNFNVDGFGSLSPGSTRAAARRSSRCPQRREIKKIAKSQATAPDLPFSTWSLSKLADFLVAEVINDISHEGLRGCCSARRRHVSADKDLEGLQGTAECP